jgi:hypothetical protein
LLNALLERPELLPTSPIPTTDLVTEIHRTETEAYSLVSGDRTVTLQGHEELAGYLAPGEYSDSSPLQYVEIGIPEMPFANTLLVDTPGTNAPVESHLATTRAYLPQADMVLYVMSGLQVGQSSDLAEIRRILEHTGQDHICLVLTHGAELKSEQKDSIVSFLESSLNRIGYSGDIFWTDAYQALQAMRTESEEELKASGIPQLRQTLQELLTEKAESAIKESEWRKFTLLVRRCEAMWASEREVLTQTSQELESHYKDAQEKLAVFERSIADEVHSFQLQLRSLGGEWQERSYQAIVDVWSDLEPQLADFDFNDPETSRRFLEQSILNYIDRAAKRTWNQAIDALEEASTLLLTNPQLPSLSQNSIIWDNSDSFNLREILLEKLEMFDSAMNWVLPMVEQMNPRGTIVQYIARLHQIRGKAGMLFQKLGPFIDQLQQYLEEKHLKEHLPNEVKAHLFQVARLVEQDFKQWWAVITQDLPETLVDYLRKEAQLQIAPLAAAVQRSSQEQETINERRQQLLDKSNILEALVSS